MNMLIRSMAPDVIAVDEIGSKEDVEALFFCAYRGCSILATTHGKNKESLSKNPYMREIINKKDVSALRDLRTAKPAWLYRTDHR